MTATNLYVYLCGHKVQPTPVKQGTHRKCPICGSRMSHQLATCPDCGIEHEVASTCRVSGVRCEPCRRVFRLEQKRAYCRAIAAKRASGELPKRAAEKPPKKINAQKVEYKVAYLASVDRSDCFYRPECLVKNIKKRVLPCPGCMMYQRDPGLNAATHLPKSTNDADPVRGPGSDGRVRG